MFFSEEKNQKTLAASRGGVFVDVFGSCAVQESVSVEPLADGLYEIRQGALVYSDLKLLAAAETAPETVRIYGYDNSSEAAQSTGSYCDIGSDMYLVALHNGRPLLQALDKSEGYRPLLSACDIDGDGEDEIIVQSKFYAWKITGLRIFKAEKKELRLLYGSPDFPFDSETETPFEQSDFGFTTELLEGYQLRLSHAATGFETVIPIPELTTHFAEKYYDAQGKPLAPEMDVIEFAGFAGVELRDADGDGVYEIAGSVLAGFGYKQSIGTAELLMKYNRQSRRMEIVQTGFSAYI